MTVRAPLQTRIARPNLPAQDVGQDSPLLNALRSQDKFFGLAGHPNFDWPNPPGRAPHPVELRTWIKPTQLNLLGKDTFFSGAGVGPDYDWPNPRGRVGLPHRFEVNLLQTTLSTAPAPFFGITFANPTGRAHPIALLTWGISLKLNLLGQDEFYSGPGGGGNTIDLGNPPLPRSQSIQRGWTQNLLGATLYSAPVPFNQDEWPLPIRISSSVDLRTWIDPLKVNLLGQDKFFGGAGRPPSLADFQNPRGRPASRVSMDGVILLQTTLAPAPFSSGDWPNPRAVGRSAQFWQCNLLESTLAPQPFAFYEWDVPLGPRPTTRQDAQNLLLPALSGTVPFTNLEWPNPQVAQAANLSSVFSSYLTVTGPGLARPPQIRRLRFTAFDRTIEFH